MTRFESSSISETDIIIIYVKFYCVPVLKIKCSILGRSRGVHLSELTERKLLG